MGVSLTSGAISKIVTGKCTSKDLKPVLQVTFIRGLPTRSKDGKQWYLTELSDGSFKENVAIADEILISNKLQKGSIVQLTKFQLTKIITSNSKGEIINKSGILVWDYNLLHSQRDIIGDPKLYHHNETPLVVRSTPTIPDKDQIHANSHHVEEPPTSKQKRDHVDSLLNENIDDSRHLEEPPTSIQKLSTSTVKCSSTQNKKRKLQSSDDIISGFGKDISKLVSMVVEKTIEDGLGACYKKLGTLEEGVSRMTKLMMEKSKEVDAGFKKLETLEEDVSKMAKMMMDKNKEDDVGACFKKLKTLEEDVSQMAKMVMEKIKEVDVGYKKLETLEEDVSKMAKMMMDKNKEDDVRTCFKKLETLEEDVSKLTRMMMEKNKEDDVSACYKKLETLEEDVSKLTRMMMEKNKEDDAGVCFKKLEALKEDVSEMSRMIMKIYKEDDMGACIEKLEKIGWGAQDPMYETALLLFGQSADYRNLWLHLKPESCGNWVKNAGSMFGLFD